VNAILLAAAISGIVSIAGVVVSYWLSKRKEREADWRKLMLENYKEFTAALSGFLEGRNITDVERERFADASNAMNLVASAKTTSVLYAFFQECLYANPSANRQRNNELISNLLLAMRRDINLSLNDAEVPRLRLMSITPKSTDLSSS
jgi:hypothetical protein